MHILHQDIYNDIFKFLDESEINRMSSTCRLFRSVLPLYQSLWIKLFNYVEAGNEEKAKSLIEKIVHVNPDLYIKLLNHRGYYRDYSGRCFENITLTKFIVWALDTQMLLMMTECHDKFNSRLSVDTNNILRTQMHSIIDGPERVSYSLNGTLHEEKHFNFQPIYDVCDVYNLIGQNAALTYEQKVQQQKMQNICGLGHEQSMLPAHILQEYCYDLNQSGSAGTTFLNPDFSLKPSRKRAPLCVLARFSSRELISIRSQGSGLGKTYYLAPLHNPGTLGASGHVDNVANNYVPFRTKKALLVLEKQRHEQLILLYKMLQQRPSISVEDDPALALYPAISQ